MCGSTAKHHPPSARRTSAHVPSRRALSNTTNSMPSTARKKLPLGATDHPRDRGVGPRVLEPAHDGQHVAAVADRGRPDQADRGRWLGKREGDHDDTRFMSSATVAPTPRRAAPEAPPARTTAAGGVRHDICQPRRYTGPAWPYRAPSFGLSSPARPAARRCRRRTPGRRPSSARSSRRRRDRGRPRAAARDASARVSVGISADTAEFAVASLGRWWEEPGSVNLRRHRFHGDWNYAIKPRGT